MEQIRSFIAIELPGEAKSGLKQIQNTLISASPSGAKWVNPESIHLTLKFLGNINIDLIDSVTRAMKEAAKSVAPFQLKLAGLGAFPNLRRTQVIWVGITGDLDNLQSLQKNLEISLSPLGFVPENRSFSPHLTLARVRENATPPERQALGDMIAKTKNESDIEIKVDSISLMKSQLTRAGAIYTRLDSIKLNASCQ